MTKRTTKPAPVSTGRGINEFAKQYDPRARIDAGIAAAFKSLGDAWEYESEFCKRAGICTRDLSPRRDALADFFVVVKEPGGLNPRRVWCGTKKFADQLRKRLA